VASVFVVESVVFGLAVLPAAVFWEWHFRWTLPRPWMRIVFLSMSFVPAYLLFAFGLMLLSALSTRVLGWRTPPDREMRIADLEWPLLDWGRYLVSTHLVRLFAGAVFRSTPVWGLYMRLNGAQIGTGVFVNSLALMDHNLLDFGDGAVVGSDAHISGHTVEHGVVKTASVHLGPGVTIGVGSVVEIGVTIGARTQVGALSFVPKHAQLEPGAVYAGAPVRRLDDPAAAHRAHRGTAP
jgi:acetyltransferase-like isoleucine patch superfamily enzyme